MPKSVLVAGASGRFGTHAAAAFSQAGWTVSLYDRSTPLTKAAQGHDVIVNGLNPPNYRNWDTEIPRITREVIAAARATGATVLLPGNVYNFGTEAGPWNSDTPQNPTARKGRIRKEMEEAYKASGVRTIILRAGDFIDTKPTGGFFDLVMAPKVAKGRFTYPGQPDIPHAWAYLPDFARMAVQLAEIRDELPVFADLPFEGFTLTGLEIAAYIERATGVRQKISPMQWWLFSLARPFWQLGRELLEMRYLWDYPHRLDGAELRKRVPDFRPTDIQAAIASALPVDVHPNQPVIGTRAVAAAK